MGSNDASAERVLGRAVPGANRDPGGLYNKEGVGIAFCGVILRKGMVLP